MAKRLDKTLADYVVGGVMPALLIGLLCSLCFFLLELAYSGAYMGQMKWILFFFIVGTVLIARISMRGDISDRAGLYGVALAIAAGLALVRFVDIPKSALGGFGWLIPFSLMSIIWWSAHKLTHDSTWDDEDEDDGGGLLDANATQKQDEQARKTKSADWFDRYQTDRQEEQRKKKPGLMVVYFSLAALPLFGIGQAMIPASNVEGRQYAFWMLTIYVGCGLGMLLTTSFLGLRRYLRGRRLQMPASMTALWLGLGVAMIVALMTLSAVLLPRPEAEYHVSQLLGSATSKEREANSVHFFEGSGGKSEKSGSGPQDSKQTSADGRQQSKTGNRQGNQGQQGNRMQGQGNQGQGKQNGQGSGNGGSGGQSGQGKQGGNQGKNQGGTGGNQKGNQAGKNQQDQSKNQGAGKQQGNQGEDGQQQRGEGDGELKFNHNENAQKDQEVGAEGDGSKQGGQQQQQKQDQSGGGSPPPPPPQTAENPASWDWLKWLMYSAIFLGILFALWKWGKQLWQAIVQIWNEIVAWWRGLLPQSQNDPVLIIPDPEARIPPKPFSWYSNPLHDPKRFQSMEEMIRYSFAALHSWAYEQNMGREPHETPSEFAQRLGQSFKHAHGDLRKLAELYAVVTYAKVNTPGSSETILRNFWHRINAESHSSMNMELASTV